MGGILVGLHGVTSVGRAILAIDKDPKKNHLSDISHIPDGMIVDPDPVSII